MDMYKKASDYVLKRWRLSRGRCINERSEKFPRFLFFSLQFDDHFSFGFLANAFGGYFLIFGQR